jgi:hypothetical protein
MKATRQLLRPRRPKVVLQPGPRAAAAFLNANLITEHKENNTFMPKIYFPSGDFTIEDLGKANPEVASSNLGILLGWAIMAGAIELTQNEENAPPIYRKKRT